VSECIDESFRELFCNSGGLRCGPSSRR